MKTLQRSVLLAGVLALAGMNLMAWGVPTPTGNPGGDDYIMYLLLLLLGLLAY